MSTVCRCFILYLHFTKQFLSSPHHWEMTKEEIENSLRKKYKDFTEVVDNLSNSDFLFSYKNKWTAGQQLNHVYLAVKPVASVLQAPKFLIRLTFGKPNRPSKSYDDLVKKYQLKLENGGRATGRYLPKPVGLSQKKKLITDLLKSVEKLIKGINRFSERELDEYILPHPLLGKVTLKEMLFFTIYHVEHHQRLMQKNLEGEKG